MSGDDSTLGRHADDGGRPVRDVRAAARQRIGRLRGDAGISTLEYLGIVSAAVLLVAGVWIVTTLYPGHIDSAFCRLTSVVSGGSGDGCAAPPTAGDEDAVTDEDLRPKVCMLSQESSGGSGEVKIAFVDFGLDWGLTTETDNEGKVKATVTNGGGAGVSASAGGDVAGMGAKVEASAGLNLSFGDSWEFTKEEWPKAEQEMRDYLSQAGWRWAGAGTLWGARAPRDPDISTQKLAVDAGVSGEIGMRAPIEGAEDYSLDVGSVNAQAAAGWQATIETNNKNGERSWIYQGELSAGAAADLLTLGASASAGTKAAFTVTRSADDDKLVSIRFQTTTEHAAGYTFGTNLKYTEPGQLGAPSPGSSSVSGGYKDGDSEIVVTSTVLKVDDSNRGLVEDWLASRGGGALVGLPFEAVVPDAASDDAFRQALFKSGMTSRSVYAAESSSTSVGGSVSAGVGFGGSLSSTESSRELIDASFLGAPDQSGKRPFLSNDKCR